MRRCGRLCASGFQPALLKSVIAAASPRSTRYFRKVQDSWGGNMLGNAKYITLEAAQMMAAAGEAEARKNNWNVAIAILDGGANLILFQKMDDTQLGSVNIAIGKARTAVHFKRPTKAIEDRVGGGRQVFLAIEGITPLQGGLPVMADGKLIGAVGVSGVMSTQDEQVAQAAVDVLHM